MWNNSIYRISFYPPYMALDKLSQEDIVELDEDKKAAMVSNLLVVLCADEAAQPVVNTGTLNH